MVNDSRCCQLWKFGNSSIRNAEFNLKLLQGNLSKTHDIGRLFLASRSVRVETVLLAERIDNKVDI